MKNRLGSALFVLLLTVIAMSAAPAAQAQQKSHSGPSKYMYLTTASLKPGSMAQFTKLEEERIADLRAAKAPAHYFSMEQITGSGMLIFFSGFDSFANLQKHHDQVWSNAQLVSKLKAINAAQGALVQNVHDSIYMYRKDLSLHVDPSLENMRFMQMMVVEVKPGHNAGLESIAKAEVKAQGSDASAHWAVFQKIYGRGSGRVYLVATPMKSLAEVDTMIASQHKTRELVGEGLTHLVRSAVGKAVSMSESDLFAFAPKLSYVPDAWLTASPDFWGKK